MAIALKVRKACHVRKAAGRVLGALTSPRFGSKRCSSCGELGACAQGGFPRRSREGTVPAGPGAGAGSGS